MGRRQTQPINNFWVVRLGAGALLAAPSPPPAASATAGAVGDTTSRPRTDWLSVVHSSAHRGHADRLEAAVHSNARSRDPRMGPGFVMPLGKSPSDGR